MLSSQYQQVVKDCTLAWESDYLVFSFPPVREFFLEVLTILFSIATTNAPYSRENKDVFKTFNFSIVENVLQKFTN